MIREDEHARAFTILVASTLLGEPYIWGGDDHDEGGFDCSGFVHEVFDRVGQQWPELAFGRVPARSIFAHFSARGCPGIRAEGELRPGCLVFFHYPDRPIFHVKLHVASGKFGHMAIDAGGAGSDSPDLGSALRHAAGVRRSSSTHHTRGAQWVAVDPFVLLQR